MIYVFLRGNVFGTEVLVSCSMSVKDILKDFVNANAYYFSGV